MKYLRIILTALLLLVFLGSTSGVQLYAHYCGDFLASVSLFNHSHCGDDEDFCETEKKMDCCEDATHLIQLDLDLQIPKLQTTDFNQPILSFLPDFYKKSQEDHESSNGQVCTIPPLERFKTPIYKKLNRFILYG